MAKYGLPGLRDPAHEIDQIIGAEHVHRRRPQLRMAQRQASRSCNRRRNGPPPPTGEISIRRVPGQHLHGVDMVKAIPAAPVPVHLLGVFQSVTGAPPRVGNEDGEALQSEKLDQRHGEPGEIRPLLALGASVDVVDQGAGPLIYPALRLAGNRGRKCECVEGLKEASSPGDGSFRVHPGAPSRVCWAT